ncbi:MAG TPA: hypothetical protein VGC90_09535, partial [Candidatus Limnocylindrales bacterium]
MRLLRRPPNALLMAVLVGALPLAVLVLLFGGGQFNPDCHFAQGIGVVGAPPAAPVPEGCALKLAGAVPVIGTDTGAAVVLMVLVVGWVAAAARLLAASRRRPGALAEVVV